jgi:phosphoglycolate phosphatase
MHYKVVVFDFDGTLVESNHIKREAYYQVFPSSETYQNSIAEILYQFPELNRFDTIGKIITLTGDDLLPQEVAFDYSKVVLEAVINAHELVDAIKTLNLLLRNDIKVYLSSNTPIDVLSKILKARGLEHYFCDISGYPADKTSYLSGLISQNGYAANEYLVVGDGQSDRLSAIDNGADFFHVNSNSLEKLYKKLISAGCERD